MTMEILGLIPARGGSRGIPRKNIRPFCGKPLLAWTVEAALASGVLSRIVVSTDDHEIADVGRTCGADVPFLRPAALAGDSTPTAPVLQHALDWLRQHDRWSPSAVMVLEPTSPSRRPFHIAEVAQLLENSQAETVASVSPVPHHYAPSKLLALHPDGTLTGLEGQPIDRMIHRRQDLQACYAFNGLVFACQAGLLWRTPPTLWGQTVMAYVVEPKYHVDLDRPDEWQPAEHQVRQLLEEEERVVPMRPLGGAP